MPISISVLLALCFFIFTYTRATPYPHRVIRTNAGKLHLYTRNQQHANRPNGDTNGLSILSQSEEELIAEDDLFWQSYKEPEALIAEEEWAQKEIVAHRKDVIKHDRQHSLSALVWWIAEGGVFPADWKVPSKPELKQMGGRGFEKLLQGLASETEDGEMIFEEGWARYAKKQYRIIVFSKVRPTNPRIQTGG